MFFHPLPLHPDVTAFTTLRSGGVSKGEYSSFNVCHYTGDNPEDVKANRKLLADKLGISVNDIVLPRQTHSTNVRYIDTPPFISGERLDQVDALITDKAGLCIGVSTADCIPVLLYDPTHHTCAAIHAGWRGTLYHIVRETVAQMQSQFGTNPTDLYAAIGPGISMESYEVGDELAIAFSLAKFPISKIGTKIDGFWHLDLPEANRFELISLGLQEDHIHSCGICTYKDERFFSARRQGIHSGRIYTAVVLH